MKDRPLVSHPLFASAKSSEILCCSRHNVSLEQHDHATDIGIANLDIEIHLWILLRLLDISLEIKETI